MRTRYFIYGLAVLLFGGLSLPSYAVDLPAGQSAFISELAHKAILSVTGETLSSTERQQRLQTFLDKDFDIPRIARFVLGRYWQKATDTERQTFTAVYRDFLARVYSQRFAKYNGETLKIIGQVTENTTDTVVYTEMKQPAVEQPLKVEWHVIDNNGYKITDISIAGISMTLAQREDFTSFLHQNGGDLSAFIQQLQTKMTAPDSP